MLKTKPRSPKVRLRGIEIFVRGIKAHISTPSVGSDTSFFGSAVNGTSTPFSISSVLNSDPTW
jgi:hypothetical protein